MDDFAKYCKNRIKYGFFRFIFFLLVACLIFALSEKFNLFSDKVYALEYKTIYGSYDNNQLGNANKFNGLSSTNGGEMAYNVGQTYANAIYGIRFGISQNIVSGQSYRMKIHFNDYDVRSPLDYSYINFSYNACSVTSFNLEDKSASGNARTINFTFNCLTPSNMLWIAIQKYNDGYYYVTTANWQLNRVSIEEDKSGTQDIINNNNTNTQIIIDNQNQNTQQQIQSQQVCDEIDKSNIKTDGYLQYNGVIEDSTWAKNNFGITDYLTTDNAIITTLEKYNNASTALCFYDKNKSIISCILNSNMTTNTDIDIPTNAKYFRASIYKVQNVPRFNYCRNGNQAISDGLNDLNSSLTDSSPVDMSSLGNTTGWLPPGPIDSIINMPLNLMNNLLTALNKTCSPISIPLPYVETNLEIPCLSTIFGQIEGVPTFWAWVGTITSVLILYNYFIALYKYYDDLTTLKANFITDFGGAP